MCCYINNKLISSTFSSNNDPATCSQFSETFYSRYIEFLGIIGPRFVDPCLIPGNVLYNWIINLRSKVRRYNSNVSSIYPAFICIYLKIRLSVAFVVVYIRTIYNYSVYVLGTSMAMCGNSMVSGLSFTHLLCCVQLKLLLDFLIFMSGVNGVSFFLWTQACKFYGRSSE